MDNGDADARLDVAKGGKIWVPPFFTEKLSDCFMAKHAIDGDSKRNNGAAETTKGTTAQRCSLHLFKYFFFFSLSEAITQTSITTTTTNNNNNHQQPPSTTINNDMHQGMT